MTRDFRNLYAHGFVRVAAVTARVHLADPAANAAEVLARARQLGADGVGLAVFPELGLSGYGLGDLVAQDVVLGRVQDALAQVIEGSRTLTPVLVVGAPLRWRNGLYNCAVVVHRGRVLGVVPKAYLASRREGGAARSFSPGAGAAGEIVVAGGEAPFGQLLFEATDVAGFCFHVEVGDDLRVPVPPSARAALAGASVLVNLAGSPSVVGGGEERHLHCRAASARCLAAHLWVASGAGESTTDLAWDGQAMIYENGTLLAESPRFAAGPGEAIADVDLGLLRQERSRQSGFGENAAATGDQLRRVSFELAPPAGDLGLRRPLDRFPFVPDDDSRLDQECSEAYSIQVAALEQRLRAIGQPKIIIGVSGGLDSTHALLVAAHTMDRLGRPRSDILAYTMPGFATSDHTRGNATELATALGCSFETLDITPAAAQMLRDIGHPVSEGQDAYDVTFENVQAGLRTDYLFRIANHRGGIVLGTGDLSELALGWCTYGVGDQMSHYGVNAGVPKTLMQHLIRWVIASGLFDGRVSAVLESILATEITPELVPTRPGEVPQSTQASIGPYELQDFTLFQVLRHGFSPRKIAFLAYHAWSDAKRGRWPRGIDGGDRHAYDLADIKRWLGVFCRRFVTQQFKRSALPDGPRVVAGGALSPRGAWQAPSDASPKVWLEDVAAIPDTW
ncbi:MAG: NAD(+) synthase [Propionibacteriaceae bacterium]|nr:NAD(+) synthase [Propionibacteriaceae bacterium]